MTGDTNDRPELSLVFGATGLLGHFIVEQLLERGKKVRVFVRQPIADDRVEQVVGDITSAEDVRKAVEGVDVVFQTVSVIDWNPSKPDPLYDVNVKGNRNVIEACIDAGVKKLVYTSSIDVVFDGCDLHYADEALPYPKKHLDHYSISKTIAEKEVIAANGRGGLLTCSLRAAGIYGPGDRVRLPTVIEALRKGKPPRLGNGTSIFSHVYVENVAYAHILAAEKLEEGSPVAGQCYFITDHDATNFFQFVFDDICKELRKGSKAPLLTNYTVAATCRDFSFTHAKAARDFGYEPIVDREEAVRRTIEDLRACGLAKCPE
jgi:sterol-4alpha-carboxylate 3-dehydrogenase (decarboxylating)